MTTCKVNSRICVFKEIFLPLPTFLSCPKEEWIFTSRNIIKETATLFYPSLPALPYANASD